MSGNSRRVFRAAGFGTEVLPALMFCGPESFGIVYFVKGLK